MKKMILTLLLLAIFSTIEVSADGHDLDVDYAENKPLATHSMLLDITRFGDGFVAVGERGHVVMSTDGSDWQQAEIVPTRSTLTSVFAFGDRLWAGGHDTVIITSGDGGRTWTLQSFDSERQQAVMDIYFKDQDNGVAIGSYGLYMRTRDGGLNWEDSLVDEENDYHLNRLIRFDDGTQLIAGEAGYSYRSFDDGETWEALALPYLGSMWGAQMAENGCVLFYGLRGHVLQSCDFGTSWQELDTGTEASISGSAGHDGLVLLAANSGTVLTRDNGRTFNLHKHSSGVDFSAALSMGDGSFLLVGENGVYRFPEQDNGGNDNE